MWNNSQTPFVSSTTPCPSPPSHPRTGLSPPHISSQMPSPASKKHPPTKYKPSTHSDSCYLAKHNWSSSPLIHLLHPHLHQQAHPPCRHNSMTWTTNPSTCGTPNNYLSMPPHSNTTRSLLPMAIISHLLPSLKMTTFQLKPHPTLNHIAELVPNTAWPTYTSSTRSHVAEWLM